jgi:hypothetical protein
MSSIAVYEFIKLVLLNPTGFNPPKKGDFKNIKFDG